jgi:DNA-directed RNA polymerase II subunit RPB1
MEPRVVSDIQNSPSVRDILAGEFSQLIDDQTALRQIMWYREPGGARVDDKSLPLPVNIARLIWNAQKTFHVDKSKPSNLHPKDVVEQVSALLERLVVVHGSDELSTEAQFNATLLFKIKVRAMCVCMYVCMYVCMVCMYVRM